MDYWEFLIQQEGDRTWLPLETKQVEILEGRYRIAAHTSHKNAPVDVRVSQLMTAEMPPRRRVRKRRSQTNENGLIIIFPYMQLQAGHWEVTCSTANVMDDLLGGGWQYNVHLQVLPRAEDDWDPNWSSREKMLGKSPDEEPDLEAQQVAESISQQMVDGLFQGIDDQIEPVAASTPPPDPATATEAPRYYELHLRQQAYMAEHNQNLALTGQVLSPNTDEPAKQVDGELWVQLRDPQTAYVVFEVQKSLQILPHQPTDFTFELKLPDYIQDVQTRVLVGELAIFDRQDPIAALASTIFTLTLGLSQLLDRLANTTQDPAADLLEETFEEEVSVYPGSTEPFSKPSETPSTLISPDLPLTPPKVKVLVPSLGLTLPPQIHQSDGEPTPSDRTPTLPSFPPRDKPPEPAPTTPNIADAETEAIESPIPPPVQAGEALLHEEHTPPLSHLDIETAPDSDLQPTHLANDLFTDSGTLQMPALFESHGIDDDDLEADLVAAALDDDGLATPFETQDVTLELDPPDLFFEEEESYHQPAQEDQLTASFQSLKLQERFWHKLTSLTLEDHQKAADLKAGMHAAGVAETQTASQPTAQVKETVTQTAAPDSEHADLSAQEVVIYEESTPVAPSIKPAAPSSNPQDLSELPILPTPTLEVPNRELTAGEMISIGIRLAPNGNRPYVKVWMNDLQTRTLIEEPRLLMHLTPNDRGELETYMRVKVPRGCLDLQIAAIAVDMTTLQESRKSVANRRVIPANMPSLSWEEFEV
ncbi:MAG: hypothetical protein AAF921_16560 [Cyanobacteria bacterium P01_D01_bin.44]